MNLSINEINEPLIQKLMYQYERKRTREKERYNERKDDMEFILTNREKAKEYYQRNKDKKREKYAKDKDYLKARNQLYYYKSKDRLDFFKETFPDKVILLKSRNVVF